MDVNTYEALVYDHNVKELAKHVVGIKDAKVGDVVICRGYYSLVTNIHEWPVGRVRDVPMHIRPDVMAIEVVTTNGTRWYSRD